MIESLRIASIVLLGFVIGFLVRDAWRGEAPDAQAALEAKTYEAWPCQRCGDHGLRYLFQEVGHLGGMPSRSEAAGRNVGRDAPSLPDTVELENLPPTATALK